MTGSSRSDPPAAPAWRLRIVVPAHARAPFESALEQFGQAMIAAPLDPDDETGPWRLELFTDSPVGAVSLATPLDIAAAATGIAVPPVDVLPLVPRDWLADSLRSFPPIAVGRFYVYGSHIATRPAHAIPIRIDAGAAFGSGDHASTAGCLLALDRLLRHRRPRRVLDMGCGTFILGIAARKAGARWVQGIDIDPVSVAVANANAARNGLATGIIAHVGDRPGLRAVSGKFDLIFANIVARPLIRMAAPLAGCLAPGGIVVLSGLLARQEAAVLAAYRQVGLRLRRRYRIGGWHTLAVARHGAAAIAKRRA